MMEIYLIDECEYVAAESKEQALEYFKASEHNYAEDKDNVEITEAGGHGYFDDYTESGPWEGDRSMMQQAKIEVQSGKSLPFHVAISSDYL